MSFVLIAKTKGDDLIHAKKTIVAASQTKEHLELLMMKRSKEREAYLAKWGDQIPWWGQCNLIAEEYIEEVLEV